MQSMGLKIVPRATMQLNCADYGARPWSMNDLGATILEFEEDFVGISK
jgi:hypothetical protein